MSKIKDYNQVFTKTLGVKENKLKTKLKSDLGRAKFFFCFVAIDGFCANIEPKANSNKQSIIIFFIQKIL